MTHFAYSLRGILCAAVFAVATGAAAQDNTQLQPQIDATREANLSIDQMISRGQSAVQSIQSAASSARGKLTAARQERDVVKVLCLNDKLNQMDVAANSAKDRMSALRQAVQNNNADRARHEYTVLDVLADRVKTLQSEAGQCVGEETGFAGESELDVTIDPNLPDNQQNDQPDNPQMPAPSALSTPFDGEQWKLKMAAVEDDCVDPTSDACAQSLEAAANYLKTSQTSAKDLQNSLAQLIQTTGNQIGSGSSNDVANPLSRVFEQVSDVLENSSLTPDQKDNVLNKFTTTTVQVALKKGLGENNAGAEARKLGTRLNRVADKTSNETPRQTLKPVGTSLSNYGTFPSNLGNAFPSYASPA